MNIIGLGKTGCDIAEKFEKYKQFSVFLIDHDIEGQNCYSAPNFERPEDYENKFPIVPFVVEDELTLLLSSDSLLALSSLKILEQYKDLSLNIIYVKPDTKFLNTVLTAVNKVVYNVFQELTRSAKIKSMYIVELRKVAEIVGKVALVERQTKIYETIAYAYYMKNMFDNIQPIFDKIIDSPSTYCIKTLGVMDLDSGEEKLFYPLDELREKRYNYYISKKELNDDVDLPEHIEEQVNDKFQENLKISYAIYESTLEHSSVFVEIKSPYIQN